MDDLTKVGYVPKRRGAHKPTSLLSKFHCVDHTAFRESCHNCLVVAVGRLLERIEDLEMTSHIHPERTIPIRIKSEDPRHTHVFGESTM